ncbi:hypothetical protein ACG7TL_000731 [Trametes sanguinea]
MPPKRKSEVLAVDIDLTVDSKDASEEAGAKENAPLAAPEPATKKARASDVGEGSSSDAAKGKKGDKPWQSWRDVVLDGEEEVRRVDALYHNLPTLTGDM